MIPCKQNKCLVFPACREKEIIYCEMLLSYIEDEYREGTRSEEGEPVHHSIWIELNQDLPMLMRIFPEPQMHVGLNTINIQSPFTRETLLRFKEGVTP